MKAKLTISVTYDAPFTKENEDLVRELLDQCANHLAGEGLLTGETDLVVDGWSCDIKINK